MKTRDMTYSALFAGVIAVSAFISIPTPLVPFTLQPFAITLCALVLSRKQALFAILIYVLSGLIGLPIFAGMSGGFQTVLKPTFGFIVGFIPMTFVISYFKEKKVMGLRLYSLLSGIVVLYLIAMPYLYFNLKYVQEIDMSLSKILSLYCLVYLPTDTLSSLMASFLSDRISISKKTPE